MPKIDIILPTYNQVDYLDRAINSIMDQDFKDFKFIIVNDGSQDATSEKLKSYNGKDERIVIIDNAVNKGLPAALNIGHSQGNSPYCTWVSTDNISYKHQYQLLYDKIIEDDYDFVQSKWIVKIGDKIIARQDIRTCHDNWGYGNLCPSFLYKRKVWMEYKYDESMLCTEDLKFYLQAYLHPFKFGHVDEFLMEYYIQPNSLTKRGNPKRKHSNMLNEIYKTVIVPHMVNKK
jgi:glycosyltransferase involved in cell wall biosynthesis